MKYIPIALMFLALLAGCAPGEGPLGVLPSSTAPAAQISTQSAYPPPGSETTSPLYPSPLVPAEKPGAYPLPGPSKLPPFQTPTPTPLPWLREDLLFQPGDLPEGIQAGYFEYRLPDWMGKYIMPDQAIVLSFEKDGEKFGPGDVSLYYLIDTQQAQKLYQQLLQTQQYDQHGVPQSGLGQAARLFLPMYEQAPYLLLMRLCHTVVQVRLEVPNGQAFILAYAGRLAQRLEAVDCQGAASVPQLPPATLPEATPTPSPAIAQVITPTVQRLPDPQGENRVRAYTFTDARHGWLALGASILATTDGGQNWQEQFQTGSQVKAITFTTGQRGWIETLKGYWLTQDGGENWQYSPTNPAGQANHLPQPPRTASPTGEESYPFCSGQAPFAGPFVSIDTHTGWAFCTSSGQDHFSLRRLFRTDDGGQTWKLIDENPPYTRFGAPDMFFLDREHGWLAVDGGLYATQDGGATWRSIQMVGNPEDLVRQVKFLSPEEGFVLVNSYDRNQRRDTLLKTTDGGQSWGQIFAAPPPAPWPDGPIYFFAGGSGVGFYGNHLLSTQDSGRTWTQAGTLQGLCQAQFAIQVSRMSFVDRQHGWATATCASRPVPGLYRTEDGGATWRVSPFNSSPEDGFVGVSFANLQTGFVVTQAGLLLRSDDGGTNFTPVDGKPVHAANIQFASPELGWELRGTTLFDTYDGGRTWQALPVGLPVLSFDLLPGGQDAWLRVGSLADTQQEQAFYRLLNTQDGGQTWAEYRFGQAPNNYRQYWLDNIQFAGAQHGWLRAGTFLFYTADGGKHWSQVH